MELPPPWHSLVLTTSPPPPALGPFAMLKYLGNYHYGDVLYNQCSFLISDKLPTQCSLVNLCVPSLEDIEEEIIFYYSDDEGYENEDVLMEIELCMPFGTQLFPTMMTITLSNCAIIKDNDFH